MNEKQLNLKINHQVILYVLVLMSFFLVYFKDFINPISHFLTLSLFFVVVIYYIINREVNSYKAKEFFPYLSVILLFIISIVYNLELSRAYIFFFIILAMYFLFNSFKIKRDQFLRAYNVTYLVYVLLSVLLYLGLVPIGREVNAFDAEFLGFNFTTFYGFLGSTASIDSYSAITVLVNLIYNRRWNGYLIAFIAMIITLGTFRATPFLVLLGPFIIIGFVKILGKKVIIPFNLLFFISFAIPLLISILLDNELVITFFDLATTGRATLWGAMIEEYLSRDLSQLLIGFGNTTTLQVDAWKENIANPHNAFFTILISYGFILYSFMYFILTKKMIECSLKQLFVIYAVLLAGISNGQLFGFFGMPMVLLLLLLISNDKKQFSKKTEIQLAKIMLRKKLI